MMPDTHVSESVPTDLDPQNGLCGDNAQPITPEQIVKEWEPSVGLDDVAITETLLDESLGHLANILKLLPARYKQAKDARLFLAQFQLPV